ncbi:MAG: hypothetical protein OXB86_00960, partial [Bdellovibrionales bacterium]|nr:hypothetical protein [Bdellovibrionales bacterium]
MLQLILSFLLFFSGLSAQGAVILKKKNRQALLHLEGLQTKPGAYFEVLDWNGKTRGLVQIKRLSKNKKKAIGVLKSGKMGKNWALEPVSRRVAKGKLQKSNNRKQALLKKRRSIRKLASARKNKRWDPVSRIKRKRKRRVPSRYVSNANEAIQEEANYEQETQNEQYMIDESSASPPQEDYYNPDFLKKVSSDGAAADSDFDVNLVIGGAVAPSLGFMKLQYDSIELLPTGMGFDGQAFVEGSMNDSIRWNVHGGYRTFSVSVQDSLCDRGECLLDMNYLIGGVGLKFNFVDKKSFNLWGGLWSDMMFLLGYDN